MFGIDVKLINKYDKPGPRYTSYPTAPQFTEGFTASNLLEEIKSTNLGNNLKDISLYFHLPFCDTLCYFCGCNMIVTRNRDRISKYLEYLEKEIDIYSDLINPSRKIKQLHWGGGTPTHLTPDEIRNLASVIKQKFNFDDNAEASCEIDPRELSFEHLLALRNSGFNRISMGVQDFNPLVQKTVNRIQPEELTFKVISWIKDLKFSSFNLDLMYGLPHQTVDSFGDSIKKIIELEPDRVALFNYAHVPWMKKHMELINVEDIPNPAEKLAILEMSINELTSAGYVFIGMDHFAKPSDELAIALKEKRLYRNFQGYSTHSELDLFALGITSISQIGKTYSQNVKTENEYFNCLDTGILPVLKGYSLNEDDMCRKKVIMKLMCDFELDFSKIENEFKINFEDYFSKNLENLSEMINDNLLKIENRKIIITEKGRLLIRNIAMNFDGFIERNHDSARYSRTV